MLDGHARWKQAAQDQGEAKGSTDEGDLDPGDACGIPVPRIAGDGIVCHENLDTNTRRVSRETKKGDGGGDLTDCLPSMITWRGLGMERQLDQHLRRG